ncbi:hypothetical protein IMX26_06710 [Clostridium sp. 'deep sea']|uniref:hypothetical protein n=1 Tax=Clostridium sp. 'deep sea' TaxID=2779445 RepID=UPI0018967D53|nr:hypothetical protein [Clostridium sp. 'deep sea']QOR36495.1 hypothetical protein IMX26_06710 [Clostridium sp. 'deep sea']
MLYNYLFNYTKKDYYNLIKEELKIMLFAFFLSLTLCTLSILGFKEKIARIFFGAIFCCACLYLLKYIITYVVEYFTMDIKHLVCHYAKITTKYDSKKNHQYHHVTFIDNKLKYQEAKFRLSTTKEGQNNIIFNGPNTILFYTPKTNILIGFIYAGKAVKFYNVDNGESLKIYNELVQKE